MIKLLSFFSSCSLLKLGQKRYNRYKSRVQMTWKFPTTLLYGSCSSCLTRGRQDVVISTQCLAKVSRGHRCGSGIINSRFNCNLLVFHLVGGNDGLYCFSYPRTVVSFQGAAFMAKNLWLSTKALPTITWHRMYNGAYDLTVWIIHVPQSIVWVCNYHTADAVITVRVCSPAALIWS